eukprot:jgi/Tetstr1/448467/TSEL_035735.t1
MHDATPAQLTFLEGELARFVESGAWELGTCRKWVSRLFLVPQPGVNQWRCIIDLRVLNSYCVRKRLKMETLLGATRLIGRATRNARWLPVRELESLAGQAQYLFLAIPAARFFMRELHSVVGDRWGGRVRMTPQLRRDPQWWTLVPSQSKPIHRPVETAYLHTESSGYGWGGVLNGRLGWRVARGFWSSADERQHITWKELKAVRLAVESFLPHLAGRNVLLLEDNQAVYHILSGLTSRSPEMMAALRRLCDDWQLDPLLFAEMESRFSPHSIDRFASALNTLLPRYNAALLDPTCEAVDSLHLPDADRRREDNWCNAPWPLLPDLVHKLQQSGAAATVVAPRWEGKAWHQALTEMAVEELTVAPRAGLFRPGRRDGRGSDTLGVQTLELLSAAWALTTAASYASCMKQYFRFCEGEKRPALAADPGTMAWYVTWLGNLGTIKASNLQLYLSAVNSFFKDHGREPMALGNLVSRVRKGLAASQVTLNPELMRAPLPARVVLKALTLAKALRLELGPTWGTDPSTVLRVELFRASLAVVVLCLFFLLRRSGGGVSSGRPHGRPGRRDPPIPL